MRLTNVLDKLNNSSHILIGLMIFAVVTTIHVWTKRDLGPQYVNAVYATYLFLGGHAGMKAWKDVKENGDSNDSSGSSSSTTPPVSGSGS
jgi:hypothetical protein